MAEKRTYTYDELVFYDEGYFSEEELQGFVASENWMERRVAAEHGVGVDKLIDDPRWEVRRAVAESGFGLDTLVNDAAPEVRAEAAYHGRYLERLLVDESPIVRAAVAMYGYRTDLLVSDEDESVRAAVAQHGDFLDVLVNDSHWEVRRAVAKQGYGLDKLVYDESKLVRLAVARNNYGFDVLVNDPDREIRGIAREAVGYESESVRELSNKALEEKAREWALEHPDRCALPEYRNREVPSLEEFFNQTAHAILHDAVEKVASALRVNYGGVAGLDDNLVYAITDVIADKVEWGLRENTAVENAAKTAAAISHARAVSLGILEEQQTPRSFKQFRGEKSGEGQTQLKEEKGRERGELKSAGKKPKQPQGEKVTLAADEMAAKRSAAARGVEGPVPEKTRRK